MLHEKKGGYANNTAAVYGLADKAEARGVRIMTGVEVVDFERGSNSDAVTGVVTGRGTIRCEQVVVAVGPWVKTIWDMLDLPREVSIKGPDGRMHDGIPTWRYWCLEEGVIGVDPDLQRLNDGGMPPVIHVDTDAPLHSDVDGSLITEEPWGIYYKPDFHFGGVQGGAMPYEVKTPADDVAIDPYGPESPEFIVGDDFAHMWCSALAFCQERFSGQIDKFRKEPSGGLGCFTPDSFPVFDTFCENVHIIADSNHGFKMIGVGHLIADEMMGEKQALLEPFRFSRYAEGKLHPTEQQPVPLELSAERRERPPAGLPAGAPRFGRSGGRGYARPPAAHSPSRARAMVASSPCSRTMSSYSRFSALICSTCQPSHRATPTITKRPSSPWNG